MVSIIHLVEKSTFISMWTKEFERRILGGLKGLVSKEKQQQVRQVDILRFSWVYEDLKDYASTLVVLVKGNTCIFIVL